MGNNLRAIIPTFNFPATSYFRVFLERMGRVFGFKPQGTFFTDILALGSGGNTDSPSYAIRENSLRNLKPEVYEQLLRRVNQECGPGSSGYAHYISSDAGAALLSNRGESLRRVKKDGVWYSTSVTKNRAIGNSYITFRRGPSDELPTGAGQISEIFLHRRYDGDGVTVEPFLVVKEYQNLRGNHQEHDPFRRIEHLDARLYYNTFLPKPHLIKLSDIISHTATLTFVPTKIKEECVVVLSLDRVSTCVFPDLKFTLPNNYYTAINDHDVLS
jgi:hypothetical protein